MADHWKISRDEKLLRNHETREEDEFQLSLSQSVRREFLWIYDSRLVLRLEILRIASALKAPLCAIYVRFIPKIEKVFIASLYVVWSCIGHKTDESSPNKLKCILNVEQFHRKENSLCCNGMQRKNQRTTERQNDQAGNEIGEGTLQWLSSSLSLLQLSQLCKLLCK